MSDGRRFAPELRCKARAADDGRFELVAPSPGLWRGAPTDGAVVRPGDAIGDLEVLGRLHRLRAPDDAFGVVVGTDTNERLGRRPVDAGTVVLRLDPEAAPGGAELVASAAAGSHGGPVFTTPLGGRYYARPSPDADPFVNVGDALAAGQTVALIEVMKTFNRVQYAGPPAKVARVVPADGDDVEAGDVLLELET